MALEKYTGVWDFSKAAHLLRRTTYGPSLDTIRKIEGTGMDGALDLLLDDISLPDPPINMDYEGDPYVPIGETWINSPLTAETRMSGYRRRSMRGWMIKLSFEEATNVREKMVLFYHNHFPLSDIAESRYLYTYTNALRKYALGDFRELVKEITVDPAMLRYLNGNQNTVNSPNENYARELLELFTVGKGELAGAGDYTTFTEKDVASIAKVLTGWRDVGYNSETIDTVYSFFRAGQHDNGTKQLSERFGNATINNLGGQEYKALIDIIFESEHVALFICRKLYRWFVYYDIDDIVEAEVIVPMAQTLRKSNYVIKPALRQLLESDHFYDNDRVGCMIKHPIDFILSSFNQFEVDFPEDELVAERLRLGIFQFSGLLQMEIFSLPSVAGWKAFYQAPGFYQIWINATTLPLRKTIVDLLTIQGIEVGRTMRIRIDTLSVIDALNNPYDIEQMLTELASLTFPKALSDTQISNLKNVLIPGLPDFEWTVEYSLYRDNPGDEKIRATVENKLILLFNTMMNMPEYHLI